MNLRPGFRRERTFNESAVLIHCAALVFIASANPGLWRVNVDGTRNITDLCEKYKIRKLIYVSSVHAIPEKRQGEVIRETAFPLRL